MSALPTGERSARSQSLVSVICTVSHRIPTSFRAAATECSKRSGASLWLGNAASALNSGSRDCCVGRFDGRAAPSRYSVVLAVNDAGTPTRR